MQQENRRKRIPGIHSYIAVINELRQELGKVTESMNELREKISLVYKQEKENSPKNNLYKRLEEVSVEIRELKEGRSRAFDERSETLREYEGLKNELQPVQGKGRKLLTAGEIESRMKEIHLKLISSKHDAKMEKAFEAEIESLRRQKKDIGMVEQKSRLAMEMREKLDGLNVEIKEYNRKISERQGVVDEIRGELKELSEQSQGKSPVVDGYERSMQGLRSRRNELNEKIRGQQEEIRKKEIEYDKFLEEVSVAQAIEKQKEEVREKISKLEEQKNALSQEKAKFDASKFDTIIFGIERLCGVGEKISVPIDLALQLSQHRIPIPVSPSQVKSTVEALRCYKEDFASRVVEKHREFENKISELEQRICEEKKILVGMPPTDTRLLRSRRD